MNILLKEESYRIVGICMKIHRDLGCGFKEIIYKDAIEIELRKQSIPFEREKKISISFAGSPITRNFVVDFLVFESIILEIKATSQIFTQSIFQTLNYLKVSGLQLGIVFNFGARSLEFKRVLTGGKINQFQR